VRLSGLRGAIVWAVTPYVAEAPFRVVIGEAVRSFASARDVGLAVRQRELPSEHVQLVQSKLRPVVLLQDRPRRALPEFAALRLVRLETLAPSRRDRIRRQEEPSLLYLPATGGRYGTFNESAVDVNALVRVHESAIVGRPVGRLDAAELRALGERLVEHLDLDVTGLLERKLEELRQRLARRRSSEGP
jgi:mRNA-degrading endonuclease toxin of MazEF toxin-antitoxin module